ncbi:MAG: hotdog fold thioesterase [Gemmatimonadota bacterium]
MTQREALAAIATNGMAGVLGIELVSIDDAGVIATMPVDHRTHQPFGILHGGASIALAETVASIGAASRIDLDAFVAVGQEINGNHLRGKSEGIVTATAKPVHVGRTSHVWAVEIVDEQGRMVCVSRCTMAIVPRR